MIKKDRCTSRTAPRLGALSLPSTKVVLKRYILEHTKINKEPQAKTEKYLKINLHFYLLIIQKDILFSLKVKENYFGTNNVTDTLRQPKVSLYQ